MFRRRRFRPILLPVLLIVGSATANADVAQPGAVIEQTCSLAILLTNDDGWDAPGIQAVREALLEAGHRVTLIAPLEQQSGRGGAINTQVGSKVAVVEQSPGVWSVEGTPTDSVRAALDVILHESPPDLVVSGANFGANLGQEGVHNSGTLGASLAAHYDGLPAIAVSTGLLIEERNTTPPFLSTIKGFATSGAIVAKLIDAMTARFGCDTVLPAGVALNVNVPVPVEDIRGIRYAPLSRLNLFRMQWHRDDQGTVRVGYRPVDPGEGHAGDDVDLYSKGFVTVTPINGDFTIEALPSSIGLPARPPAILPRDAERP
jgi:5'/3'-nucleotidase SurE